MWSSRLSNISVTKRRIKPTLGARPIYQDSYPSRPTAREQEKTKIYRMLQTGDIEPTTAGWAGLAVFVPMKYGTQRFCIEYGKLNSIKVCDSYRLPRMD